MPNLVPGTYRARAVEAELGFTKNEKPQVAVLFEVLDADFVGERITWYGYFTEKTTKRTFESLRLCGFTGDDVSDLSSINGTSDVDIVVVIEEYEGQQNLKVNWVNAPGGRGLALNAPMNVDQKKAFAAKMKGFAIASKAPAAAAVSTPPPNGSKRKPAPHPNAPTQGYGGYAGSTSDDDIPF